MKAHYIVGMSMQSKGHGIDYTLFENRYKKAVTFFNGYYSFSC